jgi:DNA-binding NarL/FixJ family response regulator
MSKRRSECSNRSHEDRLEKGAMKIFVIDPHAIYRRGLVASLELLERVEAVDQADGVGGAQQHSAFPDADVVILDSAIAGGRAFIAEVAQAGRTHVIACTSACDDEAVLGAVDAGAVGYLRKDTLTQDVLQAAVQAAAGGAAVIAPDLIGAMLRSPPLEDDDAPARLPVGRLTDREQRVLTLIAEGCQTREVAAQLSYSERTVKNVLHDVVTKLNARSRSQAVAHAVRDGLI